jgi:WD40 repeat protein
MRPSRLAPLPVLAALGLAACQDVTTPTTAATSSPALALSGGVQQGPQGPSQPIDPCSIMVCLGGGGKIIYARANYTESHIYAMSATGGAETQLDKDADWKHDATWSPDYTRVAYIVRAGAGYQIKTMKADGTDVKTIRNQPTGHAFGLSWSPDGSKLTYSATDGGQRYHIFYVTAGGGGIYQLTSGNADDMGPSFSADGTRIFFTSARGNVPEQRDIWTVTVSGAVLTRLTNTPVNEDGVKMSPDGNRLAFYTWVPNTEHVGYAVTDKNTVVVSDANATWRLSVATYPYGGGVGGVSWSRDGSYLAVNRSTDPWHMQLVRYKVAGSPAAPVTLVSQDGGSDAPSWHF